MGNSFSHVTAISTVPRPPSTTEPTEPNSAAVGPDSNSPNCANSRDAEPVARRSVLPLTPHDRLGRVNFLGKVEVGNAREFFQRSWA